MYEKKSTANLNLPQEHREKRHNFDMNTINHYLAAQSYGKRKNKYYRINSRRHNKHVKTLFLAQSLTVTTNDTNFTSVQRRVYLQPR